MPKKIYLLLLIFTISIVIFISLNYLNQYYLFKEEINSNNYIQALNEHYFLKEINPIRPNQNNASKINNESSSNKHNSLKLSPDNPKIQKYFMKVVEVPYKANYTSNVAKTPVQFWKDNSGDCDDKSTAFADYLYKKGANDVRLVTITHESGKYAHMCVMWKNHIFDATADPPIYNIARSKYYNYIKKQGFKLWVDYPYSPSKTISKNQSSSKK